MNRACFEDRVIRVLPGSMVQLLRFVTCEGQIHIISSRGLTFLEEVGMLFYASRFSPLPRSCASERQAT